MARKQYQVLVKEKKYQGKYVAFEDFNKRGVVASGRNPSKVMENARKKGVDSPVFLFVPEKGTTYLY